MGLCIDCGKQTKSKIAKRCQKCHLKILNKNQEGSNNRNYKNRLPKCLDCGKKLVSYLAKRCDKCAGIHRRKPKNYCIDCRKEINRGFKRCHPCAAKNIWKTSNKMQNRNYEGKCNPNYIDGKSNEPYPLEFNEELKLKIRKRDNYTCQICDVTEEEYITVFGISLCVHHIDYDKQNCDEGNLITLCNQCNIRVNYNRKYWILELGRKLSWVFTG